MNPLAHHSLRWRRLVPLALALSILAAIGRPLASQCQPEWLPGDGFEVNGSINALVMLPNGDLIAGGSFSSVGGVAANNIARWNGWTWAPMGSGMDDNFPAVLALAVLPNGDLIAGGSFYSAEIGRAHV